MKNIIGVVFLLVCFNINAQWIELSDEFDKTCDLSDWINIETTEGWDNSHLESFDVNLSNPGKLTMMPWTTAWYASRRSNLLYKEVSGDFVFTSEVTAMNKTGDDQPSSAYSLAGLMIRTPKVVTANGPIGDENYVFLSIGTASSNAVGQFEIKNTVNSNSSLNITNIGTTTAQIRMVRVGGAIVVMYRLPGGEWEIRNRYNRSDMPVNVQVGFVTYTDWDKVNTYSIEFHNENTLNADLDPDPSDDQNQAFNPDIIGQFEYGRFTEAVIDPTYAGSNFWTDTQVPDEVIIDMFGYDSTPIDVQGWKIWNGTNSNWNDASNWQDGFLPTSQDSILIPNCECPNVVFPSLDSGVFSFSSLIIEEDGQLDINTGATLNVDLIGDGSQFSNSGTINNFGILSVINTTGKSVLNQGILDCAEGAVCQFEE